MIPHSVHTLKEGAIESNAAVARLRLVHRDETQLALLSADDEVLAEFGLAAECLRECYETGGELLSLMYETEEMWVDITFERYRRKDGLHFAKPQLEEDRTNQPLFGLMFGPNALSSREVEAVVICMKCICQYIQRLHVRYQSDRRVRHRTRLLQDA